MRGGMMALAMMFTAPATAQTVTLVPGESVELRIVDGAITEQKRGHAEIDDADRAFLVKIEKAYQTKDSLVFNDARPDDPPRPIAPDATRVDFVLTHGKGALLIWQNGYDQAVVYRARMTANGRYAATNVCLVIPGKRTYEHWPHPIERIELSDIRLEPWSPGDSLRCE